MIYQVSSSFATENVQCEFPKPLPDSLFISKLTISGEDILLQTPKCTSKEGLLNASKKTMDVIFKNEAFTEWIMSLEERVKRLIYEKRDVWFMENTITMDDIEHAFVSILVPKGNGYTLRVQVPPLHRQFIFNESKMPVDETNLKESTPLIHILHFVGVRFNTSMFQLVVHVKQIMALSEATGPCLIEHDELLDISEMRMIEQKEEELKRAQLEIEELRRKLKNK